MIEGLRFRNSIYRFIREFFNDRDYQEVETPIMVAGPGAEVHLRYFASDYLDGRGQWQQRWLRSSPELHMKQLLTQGLARIFQIGKCFRNGGELSDWHHPEFTLLEYYATGTSFDDFIDFTINFLQEIFIRHGTNPLGRISRISVHQAFRDFANIELVDNDADLARKGTGCLSLTDRDDFETAFAKILIEVIEPRLADLGTVVLYDYPPSQAALAQIEGGVAKRFEVYINGLELSNAFLECTDYDKNRQRFIDISAHRQDNNLPPLPIDQYFFSALAKGLPPCCGNALGIDRLLALLLGKKNIHTTIPFAEQFLQGQ